MKNLIIKPRVFLSHSKKDENFIKRVSDDFKKCQIESIYRSKRWKTP